MNRLMALATILAIFIGVNSIYADEYRKHIIKKTKTIQITSIDTAGYGKAFVYPDENLNDIFEEKLDSLMASWYVQSAFVADSLELEELENGSGEKIADSVYVNRMAAINSFIDLSYNKTVRNLIELYTKRRREQVRIMLGLSQYYFPIFEETLDKYDLPLELKYLPIIESALNPRAVSRVGARGLWQFMYWTGKPYKLEMNSYVDQRHDPIASTEAAAKFLKDLYKMFGDWHLVIAAYNCGPGNVRKAIRRSGGARDFWKIYYRLPRETRGYVPSFIAATYVMNYYREHNLVAKQPSFPVVADTVMVHDYLNLKQVSTVLDVPLEQIRDYNPQYKTNVIPATKQKAYALRLPQTYIGEYIDREKEIMVYKRNEFFPDNRLKTPSSSKYTAVNIKGKSKVYYTVKSGDNLGFIADWYDVGVSSLRYWNNIRRNLIRVGQRLVVYVPSSKVGYYRGINRMSASKKRKLKGKSAPVKVDSKPQKIDGRYEYHTVRRNENLWLIARKYPGISAQDIMRLNNMRKSSIRVGQKLKIRRRS